MSSLVQIPFNPHKCRHHLRPTNLLLFGAKALFKRPFLIRTQSFLQLWGYTAIVSASHKSRPRSQPAADLPGAAMQGMHVQRGCADAGCGESGIGYVAYESRLKLYNLSAMQTKA